MLFIALGLGTILLTVFHVMLSESIFNDSF